MRCRGTSVDQRQAMAKFRQFMSLERRRSAGLSPHEFSTWMELKRALDRAFGARGAPSGVEIRATPRVPVTIRVSFDAMGAVGSSLMTNLSRGGLFVPIEHPPDIGTKLELRITIAEPATEIRAVGVVASKNLGPDLRSDQRGMGIRFADLSSEARRLIDDLYESEASRHLEKSLPEEGRRDPA